MHKYFSNVTLTHVIFDVEMTVFLFSFILIYFTFLLKIMCKEYLGMQVKLRQL